MRSLPLFERFPALAKAVPWTPVVAAPTPVELLPRLATRCGLESLHVKREDMTHPIVGGNKVRGLEFLLGDALARKANTLVTFGAVGSNHVAATAWHGRQVGLNTTAFVMAQPQTPYVPRNLVDGLSAGARLIPVNALTAIPRVTAEWLRLRKGRHAFRIVPPGGTTPLSCLGHVNAALELRSQIEQGILPIPDFLIVGLGSLGTAAGLLLGCRLARLPIRIIGVVVFHRWYCTAGRCASLARRTLRFMQRHDATVPDVDIHAGDIDVVGTALGRGYAHTTSESAALASELSAADELALDATYTSKTLTGGLDWIETHGLQGRNVLYWHTFHARSNPTPDEIHAIESALHPRLRKFLVMP